MAMYEDYKNTSYNGKLTRCISKTRHNLLDLNLNTSISALFRHSKYKCIVLTLKPHIYCMLILEPENKSKYTIYDHMKHVEI